MELEYNYNPKNFPDHEDTKPLVDISFLTKEEKRAILIKGGVHGEWCKTEEDFEIFLAVRFDLELSHIKNRDDFDQQIEMLWDLVELARSAWHKRHAV